MARVREIPGARRQIFNEVGEAWADSAGPQLEARARGFAGYWTGELRRRMTYERKYKGGRFYSVRFGSDVPYAEIHEKGRGPVFPVKAKVLRWFDKVSGKPIFRMKAGPAAGRFYLYKALKALGLRGVRRIG